MTRLLISIGRVEDEEGRPEAAQDGEPDEQVADPDGQVAGAGTGCEACGFRGWKYGGFRRSADRAGDAGEQAPLTRSRVPCQGCTPPAAEGGGRG